MGASVSGIEQSEGFKPCSAGALPGLNSPGCTKGLFVSAPEPADLQFLKPKTLP